VLIPTVTEQIKIVMLESDVLFLMLLIIYSFFIVDIHIERLFYQGSMATIQAEASKEQVQNESQHRRRGRTTYASASAQAGFPIEGLLWFP
jgi:hypothetical protein